MKKLQPENLCVLCDSPVGEDGSVLANNNGLCHHCFEILGFSATTATNCLSDEDLRYLIKLKHLTEEDFLRSGTEEDRNKESESAENAFADIFEIPGVIIANIETPKKEAEAATEAVAEKTAPVGAVDDIPTLSLSPLSSMASEKEEPLTTETPSSIHFTQFDFSDTEADNTAEIKEAPAETLGTGDVEAAEKDLEEEIDDAKAVTFSEVQMAESPLPKEEAIFSSEESSNTAENTVISEHTNQEEIPVSCDETATESQEIKGVIPMIPSEKTEEPPSVKETESQDVLKKAVGENVELCPVTEATAKKGKNASKRLMIIKIAIIIFVSFVAIVVVGFFLPKGVFFGQNTAVTQENQSIVITAGEANKYSQKPKPQKDGYIYVIPAGTYKVTMLESSTALQGTLAVETNKVVLNESGIGSYENIDSVDLVIGGSTTITVGEDEHIYLSIKTTVELTPQKGGSAS